MAADPIGRPAAAMDDRVPERLIELIAARSAAPAAPGFDVLAALLQERFGCALAGVLLYGSSLRSNDPADGVVDLYAVVDNYAAAYSGRCLRLVNAVLPPNVFYLETVADGVPLRCKYAVISLADLAAGTDAWFHPYLWARFAQPVRILFARDEPARRSMVEALAQAALTFLENVIPALDDGDVSVQAIWERGFGFTYGAEIRPEYGNRAANLAHAAMEEYRSITAAAEPVIGACATPMPPGTYRVHVPAGTRRRARRRWRLRRIQGKALSLLRLAKAAVTFRGGVDYAAWKIERHTGMHVEVTPRLRRWPLVFGWGVLWRLLRRGALR